MASILTNSSALTALQTLSSTNKSLETTQNRISTGLRIGEASDNASYWSIATSMKSDNKANSAVQDALGLGAGKVDTAYSAINKIKDSVDQIKEKLVTAIGASTDDKVKIEAEIKSIVSNINSAISNANYAGSNLLDGSAAGDLEIVSSYNRSEQAVTIDMIKVVKDDTDASAMVATIVADGFFASTMDDDTIAGAPDPTTGARSNGLLDTVEAALAELVNGAATLGAAKSQIDSQKSFLSGLSDSIEKGVGQLIDADMNKESARLSALQVQQQLGVQALSIANSSNQNILSLFR
ncbi:flagellin [Falsochrobactrum shanghaiense]|uniref:Flagellin n=1 Tax=Falsochrobactrum shanghaiense TaxID=2201899 RepID=A0A316J970_9HYPH|nr:flagellin [Falsochrobactrum shanghaiense]PWL17315.1 flagellin [Falsochrobactrum shanghaiense]